MFVMVIYLFTTFLIFLLKTAQVTNPLTYGILFSISPIFHLNLVYLYDLLRTFV